MGINKPAARTALLLSIVVVTFTNAAEKRDWKQGTLISMETTDAQTKVDRRYECVVSDGTFSYTMEYEHPIKATVHRPIKFVIEKDTLIILDPDGRERPAHIEKRERVLYDSPGPRL